MVSKSVVAVGPNPFLFVPFVNFCNNSGIGIQHPLPVTHPAIFRVPTALKWLVSSLMHLQHWITVLTLIAMLSHSAKAQIPADYKGKPFADAYHKSGIPTLPGILQCALYDLGGEGIAYHDTDALNNGSGKLNLEPGHQRAHAGDYLWHFRREEGVDLSFVKDWADLNHTNQVSPHINQLYIGWTENDEWCNYTVKVSQPGTYRIRALYSFQTNTVRFDLNGKPASVCKLPTATPGYHHWNYAPIGTIVFPTAGTQLLTFHYGKGNNFAYFEFERLENDATSPAGR